MDSAIRRPTSSRLVPAADMVFSVQTMADSFFMSNMSPQKPAFNRGIWKRLEEQVRQIAICCDRTNIAKEKDCYDRSKSSNCSDTLLQSDL